MVSILQNFICTKPKRLELIKKEVPNMAKVFKNYNFFINYNSTQYFEEVYEVYKNNVTNFMREAAKLVNKLK